MKTDLQKRFGFLSRVLNLVPAGQRAALLIVAMLVALGYFYLAGCASLTTPQTTAQRLAYADSQFTALVESATELRETGALDAGDAAALSPLFERGSELLDAAWAAYELERLGDVADRLEQLQRLLPEIRHQLEQADEHARGAEGARGPDHDRHQGAAERPGHLAADPLGTGRGPGPDGHRARGNSRTPALGARGLARPRLKA